MRVLMRTNYAGPAGACHAGGVIDVSDVEAKTLIKGGFATEAPPPKVRGPVDKVRGPVEEQTETATTSAPETTSTRPARPRRS